MAELNTKVEGSPEQCDAAAEWFGTVSTGVHDIATDVRGAQATSESAWRGTAGDAFRGDVGEQAGAADELSGKLNGVKGAISTFAGELRTVKSRIEQARGVAAEGGCELTATGIVEPGPAPQASGLAAATGPVPPEQAAAHTEAVNAHKAATAAHEAKVRAFNEAQMTVAEMRQKEAEAHKTLVHALRGFHLREFNDTKQDAVWGATTTLAAARTLDETSQKLFTRSGDLAEKAARATDSWAGWWGSLDTRMKGWATKAAGHTVQGPVKPLGALGRGIIDADPLNTGAKEGSSRASLNAIGKADFDLKGDSAGKTAAKFGTKAVKGVPLLGTAVSVGSGVVDVATGSKSVGEAAASTGGSVVGGAVGTAAGAAIGSAVPVVGTAVGGFLGGLAGSAIGEFAGGLFD